MPQCGFDKESCPYAKVILDTSEKVDKIVEEQRDIIERQEGMLKEQEAFKMEFRDTIKDFRNSVDNLKDRIALEVRQAYKDTREDMNAVLTKLLKDNSNASKSNQKNVESNSKFYQRLLIGCLSVLFTLLLGAYGISKIIPIF